MHLEESNLNPIDRCIMRAHSENSSTSEKARKIINVSLIAVQLAGLILLAASIPATSALVSMPENITLGLALGGTALLIGGSVFWSLLGYHQKPLAAKKGIYALTIIAISLIAIGAIALNGYSTATGISAARCVLFTGYILSMALIFPYLFSFLKFCHSKLDNCLKSTEITPQSTQSSRHFSKKAGPFIVKSDLENID